MTYKELNTILESKPQEYLSPLQDLVALDTSCIGHGIDGGREKAGQDYIAQLMRQLGGQVKIVPMCEEDIQKGISEYGEGNPGHVYKDRSNVYATFKGGSGKSLMFNGHIDTIPAEDEARWSVPPLSAEVRDGKLYGLGVCDMKGGLMASVMAVKLLKDAGIDLPGTVFITSVADEEGGGNGSIAAAIQGLKADSVLVCEPTSDELIAATMGFVFFRVEVEGLSIHSGAKWLGVSAIDKCLKLISALGELEHKWLLQYKHPLLPPPNLNVGTIRGGSVGSTVPGSCMFETCIHYHPGTMSHNQIVQEFTQTIACAADGDIWLRERRPKLTMYQSGGAYEMNIEHPFVRSFERAFTAVRGVTPKITGSPAGCDSRIWRNIAGCPTLQYGPGFMAQCHSVDEYLDLSVYYETILIYAQLILDWCK